MAPPSERRSLLPARILAAALLLGANACTEPPNPASLTLVSGDGQSGQVGQALPNPLVVKVSAASGAGISGRTVTWTVVAGGGKMSTGSSATGATGDASVTLTLGNASGANRVTATIAGLAPVVFSATALPASPARVAFAVQPSSVAAGVSISPAVQVVVQDSFGNAVTSSTSGLTLYITPNTGTAGAHLRGTTTVNAAGGVATFSTLSVDSVGAGYALTASGAGLLSTASAAFNVTWAPAVRLGFAAQPSNVTAGAPMSPAVKVAIQDSLGNTVTSSATGVTLAITNKTGTGGAHLRGTTSVSAVSGVAAFSTLSVDSAGGSYTLTASAAGVAGAVSVSFDVTIAPASRVTWVLQPTNGVAGAALSPSPTSCVTDSLGNKVATATSSITVGIATGSGTTGAHLRGTTTGATSGGCVTFATLSIDSSGASYALTASATGLAVGMSAPFAIAPAPAAKLSFTVQPTDVSAGAPVSPAVAVALQDSLGNTVSSSAASVTAALSGNTGTAGAHLRGATTRSAVSGVAVFSSVSLDSAGTGYTLTASAAGLPAAVSTPFNVTPAPAARLGFTAQPSDVAAGAPMSPAVKVAVQDSLGNTVTSSTAGVTLAITSNTGTAGAHLRGAATVSAVSGVATFSTLSVDSAGAGYTLSASVGSLQGKTSVSFRVSPGPATRLAFSAQPTSAIAGVIISRSVGVAIQDSLGNTVTSSTASITLAITNGTGTAGATLGGTTVEPAVSGVSTFSDLTIDRTGTGYTFTASAAALTSATSRAFSVTLTVAAIGEGYNSTCGITAMGAAFCWGANAGVFGNGAMTGSLLPVGAAGGMTLTALSVGQWNACGLTTNGGAYCWGSNAAGQLGNGGQYVTEVSPVAVSGGYTFSAISAGYGHTCGITTSGAAYCWGDGGIGQLGNATTTSNLVPVPVFGSLVFRSISVGAAHTCGVTTAGIGYCWGDNSNGQLGIGSTANYTIPVAVAGNHVFASISAGQQHTCALSTDGTAYCWGLNGAGQLGDGSGNFTSASPVAVSFGQSFSLISAGDFYTCGLTGSGAAYC